MVVLVLDGVGGLPIGLSEEVLRLHALDVASVTSTQWDQCTWNVVIGFSLYELATLFGNCLRDVSSVSWHHIGETSTFKHSIR